MMRINKRFLTLLLWSCVFVAALSQLFFFTHIQSDISAFMPPARDDRQALLLEELQKGPVTRIWLLALEGGSPKDLAIANKKLAAQLRATKLFRQVQNGENLIDDEARDQLMQYRYLLDPRVNAEYFSVEFLHRVFSEQLEELRSPLSVFKKRLVPSDPTSASMQVIRHLQVQERTPVVVHGVWFSETRNRALLVAESTADGVDLDAQEKVLEYIKSAFRSGHMDNGVTLIISGAPFFALETRSRIQNESRTLFIITSIFIVTFMLLVYRNIILVALTALPLMGGVLTAVATVSVLFGSVHGITLVFGATLLGVAIDYPVHVLSHLNEKESLGATVRRIWPTLRLGVLTTVLGYAAMAWTEFVGLAQLGLFTISGLLSAALITRSLMPALYARGPNIRPRLARLARKLEVKPALGWRIAAGLLVALGSVPAFTAGTVWSNDISDLSPIPVQLRKLDREIRGEMGAPDPRHVILVKGDNVEEVLQQEERLQSLLQKAIKSGYLGAVDSAAQILPSKKLQRQRQEYVPNQEILQNNVTVALKGLAYKEGVFIPFIRDLARTRYLQPLSLETLQSTALSARLRSLLRPYQDGVVGVVRLVDVYNPAALKKLVKNGQFRNIWYTDLKLAADNMVRDFRHEVIAHLGLILLLIIGVLAIGLRKPVDVGRVLLPVGFAIVVAAASAIALNGTINIFHLVSLMLVGGVGLDYALFFLRHSHDSEEAARTAHSLVVCGISTVTVFSILASSSIPVLHAIGTTVAVGTAAAFIFSWLFARTDSVDGKKATV